MRWFYRTAKIDQELRTTFEQYGVGTMQSLLAAPARQFVHLGKVTSAAQHREELLSWLKEQYDRQDTKETWSLTMEFAITMLVALEVVHLLWPGAPFWPQAG